MSNLSELLQETEREMDLGTGLGTGLGTESVHPSNHRLKRGAV